MINGHMNSSESSVSKSRFSRIMHYSPGPTFQPVRVQLRCRAGLHSATSRVTPRRPSGRAYVTFTGNEKQPRQVTLQGSPLPDRAYARAQSIREQFVCKMISICR